MLERGYGGPGTAVDGRVGASAPYGASSLRVPAGRALDMMIARQEGRSLRMAVGDTRRVLLGARKRAIHDAGDDPLDHLSGDRDP
ncbi:hypothetical protein CBP36_20350 (plasmid) [Acidovorax carolinensis]|uniref:Uncharacterized protein n=1 Tax=Acidovorax carolinensis TaxID=553814 RepID=A0A240UIN0_9BURK|nr:hypothetical protein CBP35_20425 [Acidovorax carolinensis]ART61328.1 hypothetical protein CBP36_20350 [Acidovorax carolinensis]